MDPVPESVTAHVKLSLGGTPVAIDITVPNQTVRLVDILPVFRTLADAVVATAVDSVESAGSALSCRKGCGACCRQLVPLAEAEARDIQRVIDALPEPRRAEVRSRFASAIQQLERSGLLETLRRRAQWGDDERRSIGLAYFRERIPCPFLEDESCSIYSERPTACREYLVTSPAANCAEPSAETVRRVKIPLSIWPNLARFDPVEPGAKNVPWVPLVLAPEWAESHPDDASPRPAPEWLRSFFERLTQTTPVPPLASEGEVE